MSNPTNHGSVVGRVTQAHKVFENANGSKTVLVTLAVDNNYRSGPKQEVQTNLVPLRAYVPAGTEGLGSWDRVNVGDQIAQNFRIAAVPYEKDGITQYPVTLETDGPPAFLESRATTAARAAKRNQGSSDPAGPPAGSKAEQLARLEAELAAADGGDQGAPSAENPFG